MNDWVHTVMTAICQRFGSPRFDAVDDKLEEYDDRLSQVEREQRDQEARVRLLEYQANPRGRLERG